MNATKEKIKKGCKQTSIGIIPNDWEVKHFADISDIDKESLNSNTPKDYEFDYISLSDVDSDEFKIESSHQVFDKAPSRARRIVKQGDILMSTVRPNLQGFSLIRSNVNNLIASTGFAVITAKKCNNNYLFQYLFSNGIQRQFYQLIVGSNYPAINSSDVKKLKIPIPPLPEQQKIASILSTWDDAITKQKSLVEQTKKRNQGLAQQLLTGKKRLKGFDGEWNEVKADKIFKSHTNKNHNGDLEILSATQERGVIPRSMNNIDIKYDVNSLGTYKKVEVGDFVISLRSFQGGIEYSEYEGIVSPAYTILKEIIPVSKTFYKVYFKTGNFIKRLNTIIYGIRDGKQIGFGDFSTLKLPCPEFKEQEAISKVLEQASFELKKLEQQLTLLQNEKKGLMQKLLTGEIRVKIN